MSHPRRGLGRGLDALISTTPPGTSGALAGEVTRGPHRWMPEELDIDLIAPNPEQPRTHFEPAQLHELADSIREHGIIQPLVVSRAIGGGYQLVAGERRLQAARLVGLRTVPIVMREVHGDELLELALVENIQRADLNAIEEAMAYRRLIEEHHLTQEEAAKRVGKSRAAVANSLRLLGLEPELRRSLVGGEISEGHARALLGLADGHARSEAWRQVVRRGLSVRETEALVRRAVQPDRPDGGSRRARPRDPVLGDIERQLERALSTRVRLSPRKDGARIIIECYSAEELDSVVNQLLGGIG